MKFKRSIALLLVLLATMLAPTIISAQGGKSVTIGWPQEPDSLNPMYTTMTYAGYTISLFYSGAWAVNSDLQPVPVLVSEIPTTENGGISEDGTTFTLKLKDGLTWSDGEALTSADFLFTAEMFQSEKNSPLGRGLYQDMVEVTAPDATTVVVKFANPLAAWLGLFSFVLPEHVFRPVFDADGSLDNAPQNREPTVSSGPYTFTEWNVGNFMSFTANPGYTLGQPKIDTLIVRFFGDDETYVNSLVAGEISIATFFDWSYAPKIEEAGITVQAIPSGYNEGWFFNVGESGHPALQDVNVRKAVSMAFDRLAITEDLFYGATYPGSSFWEATPFANPDLKPVAFDPDAANKLLDDAGWVDSNGDGSRDKDGVELELRFVTNTRPIRAETIGPIVQQQLGAVGVKVELQSYPSDQYFNGYAEGGPIATGQYDIAEWSSSPDAFPDPHTRSFRCDEVPSPENPSGSNWNYYCDEKLTDLFKQEQEETDSAKRIELFHEIDQMIYDSSIWTNIWFDADSWAVAPNLTADVNGVSPFWNVEQWDLTQ
ncbi:MAG TPA: peptide ABC transporter substrate-binding protein [Phototrophicaceae bacterium]|nr:peptide ABC transporter substrate-binding protein [Phototrophicaceae bacterium]